MDTTAAGFIPVWLTRGRLEWGIVEVVTRGEIMKTSPLLLALLLTSFGCEDAGPSASSSLDATDTRTDADGGVPPDAVTAPTDSAPRPTDAARVSEDALPVVDATVPDSGQPARVHRAPCFEGEPVDPGLTPLAQDCIDLFDRRDDLESGCYVLDDGLGAATGGYCWRKRALVLLVNNEIDLPPHPEDADQDGVIDSGDLAGTNFPPDPFGLPPAEVAAEIRRTIHDYFAEFSYGALSLEVDDVHWAPGSDGRPDRWFRLQRERPTFANEELFETVCRQRGGMTVADWERFDLIVTVVNYGTSTSGSQGRDETLPVGPDCTGSAVVWRNYIVMKQFRGWNRMGTFFHELIHGLARDPADEPSIGHSEAVHAETGALAEYGDLTDLMGESSTRGQLSLPQRLFLRYLPTDAIELVESETPLFEGRVHPLETRTADRKGLRIPVPAEDAYYVEVRRDIGNDRRLPDIFKQGVLIKRAKRIDRANKSFIVDPTPETPSARSTDSVLLPQRTFADREKGVFISVLTSDAEGADVVVRRGPVSIADPTEVTITQTRTAEGVRLQATARPGDPAVRADELLYFWKLRARERAYAGDDYALGADVTLDPEVLTTPTWLVVSDQRGGETWTEVTADP